MTTDLWATLIPAVAALLLALAGYIKSRTAVKQAGAAHELASKAHAKATDAMVGLTGKVDKPAEETVTGGPGAGL